MSRQRFLDCDSLADDLEVDVIATLSAEGLLGEPGRYKLPDGRSVSVAPHALFSIVTIDGTKHYVRTDLPELD